LVQQRGALAHVNQQEAPTLSLDGGSTMATERLQHGRPSALSIIQGELLATSDPIARAVHFKAMGGTLLVCPW